MGMRGRILAGVLLVVLLCSGCRHMVPEEHKQSTALAWAATQSALERHDIGAEYDPWPLLRELNRALWYQVVWLEGMDPDDVPEEVKKVWAEFIKDGEVE